jgi:flavoprotein
MLVIPTTLNTINKWAKGIGDTLMTSLLCEALGGGSPPIIAVPCLKMDLVRHPAFSRSVALLCECGVQVRHEPERYQSPLMVPLDEILAALSAVKRKNM